jgi:hypothetical protein
MTIYRETSSLRRLAWLSLAGPVAMIVTIFVAASLDPDYSHRQPVSLLAAEGAPTAPMVTFGFFSAGVGLMILMTALWRLKTPLGRGIPAIGFTSGALITASSFFPCSPGCPAPWSAEASAQDTVHFALVLSAVIGFGIAPTMTWFRLRGRRGWVRYRRATGLLALAIVGGGFLTFTSEALQVVALENTTGIWQRISLGSSVVWFVLTAAVALTRSGSISTEPPVNDRRSPLQPPRSPAPVPPRPARSPRTSPKPPIRR